MALSTDSRFSRVSVIRWQTSWAESYVRQVYALTTDDDAVDIQFVPLDLVTLQLIHADDSGLGNPYVTIYASDDGFLNGDDDPCQYYRISWLYVTFPSRSPSSSDLSKYGSFNPLDPNGYSQLASK